MWTNKTTIRIFPQWFSSRFGQTKSKCSMIHKITNQSTLSILNAVIKGCAPNSMNLYRFWTDLISFIMCCLLKSNFLFSLDRERSICRQPKEKNSVDSFEINIIHGTWTKNGWQKEKNQSKDDFSLCFLFCSQWSYRKLIEVNTMFDFCSWSMHP